MHKLFEFFEYPTDEVFEDNYLVDPASGCWLWQRRLSDAGYGTFRRMLAHRWSFVHKGHQRLNRTDEVHHKCTNPSCVNPDHLEAKTKKKHIELHRKERRHNYKGRVYTGPYLGNGQYKWGNTLVFASTVKQAYRLYYNDVDFCDPENATPYGILQDDLHGYTRKRQMQLIREGIEWWEEERTKLKLKGEAA